MEIRRQHQPDGDRNQRSLHESKQRTVRDGSETARSAREERVETGKERAAAARDKQTHTPIEARRHGADSVQISEHARRLAEAETGHVDGADKRAEHQANVAKHLRKQAQRLAAIREDQASESGLQAAPMAHAPEKQGRVDPGIADHLRKQAQRLHAIRMDQASETHRDVGHSERVAGLRHEHDSGRLNTPDRIQRAAHRMLGGDS